MPTYPIRFPEQLREHLRALRKTANLSQAEVGAQLGVSQARIAEIEANPGLVSFDQLSKLLAVLGAGFKIETSGGGTAETSAKLAPEEQADEGSETSKRMVAGASTKLRKKTSVKVIHQPESRAARVMRELESPAAKALRELESPAAKVLRELESPAAKALGQSARVNKKGSW